MKKILWYGDFLCPTGFGMVNHNLVERLMKEYQITVLGINHHGDPYNYVNSPYYKFKDIPVYPARNGDDMFGRGKLLHMLDKGEYDALFILQDLFNILPIKNELIELKKKKGFKIIFYFPIDGKPVEEWKEIINAVDMPVTYTDWGKEQLGMPKLKRIYHGVDKNFFPVDKMWRTDYREKVFGIKDDTFLILNVNRNQPRKDLTRCIRTFDLFNKKVPKSFLYLHCNPNDPSGLNLNQYVLENVPHLKDKIGFSSKSIALKELNLIYNAADVMVSTTLGEGWGLSTTEAMMCEVPVIIPDNTTGPELLGEDRGYLVKSGNTSNQWINMMFDNCVSRPITDVYDLCDKIEYVYNHRSEAKKTALNAKKWVSENCDWDNLVEQWMEVFKTQLK